jgi:hypothetical protein
MFTLLQNLKFNNGDGSGLQTSRGNPDDKFINLAGVI